MKTAKTEWKETTEFAHRGTLNFAYHVSERFIAEVVLDLIGYGQREAIVATNQGAANGVQITNRDCWEQEAGRVLEPYGN